MLFRVGINLGETIEKTDGTIYGDGVNIAARLQALAEPGAVCVSEAVAAQTRGKVDATFIAMGAHTVKNIAEPVRAYRVAPAGAPGQVGTLERGVATETRCLCGGRRLLAHRHRRDRLVPAPRCSALGSAARHKREPDPRLAQRTIDCSPPVRELER